MRHASDFLYCEAEGLKETSLRTLIIRSFRNWTTESI